MCWLLLESDLETCLFLACKTAARILIFTGCSCSVVIVQKKISKIVSILSKLRHSLPQVIVRKM